MPWGESIEWQAGEMGSVAPKPLTTARLVLLPWPLTREAHRDGLISAWNDPAVWRWVGAGTRSSYSRQELDDVLRRAPERGFSYDDEWVVTRAEDGVVLGAVWLAPWWTEGATEGTPMLGYRYGQHAWGHGYGAEAAAAVMAEAERRGHTRVESSAYPDNTASHRILLRLNFQPTDTRPLPEDPSKVVQWYAWRAQKTFESPVQSEVG
jgi:RimJ/RimL family protein N-acetyltransferase